MSEINETPIIGIVNGTKKGETATVTVKGVVYTGTAYPAIGATGSSNTDNAYPFVDITVVQGVNISARSAIRDANDTVIFDNVTVANCKSTSSGGLFINDSTGRNNTVLVYDSTVTNCSAADHGAMIFSNLTSYFTISNTVISNNHAGKDGGVLALVTDSNNPELTIADCRIFGNTAGEKGGVAYLSKGMFTISGSTLTANTAQNGGAFYTIYENSSANISDSVFDGNTASNNGGAFYLSGGTHTFSGLTFTGNTALGEAEGTGLGNAVYCKATGNIDLTIIDSTFGKNQTIYTTKQSAFKAKVTFKGDIELCDAWEGTGTYTVDGATLIFNNDSALDFGTFAIGTNGLTGVVFNGEAVTFNGLNLSDSAVVINGERSAGLIAAGITLGSDQQVVWDDVVHTLNTGYLADSREAVYALKYADKNLTLTATDTLTVNGANNNFDQFATLANAVNAYDGFTGKYDVKIRTSMAAGNSLSVKNATFTAAATNYGGALMSNEGEFSGENVFFIGGSATGHSGAIYNNGGLLTITGGSFADNAAQANSGALRNNNNGTMTFDSVLFSGNKTIDGAGVGGAIRNESGTLVVKNSAFTGNNAGNGGAIFNSGLSTVENCTFTENNAGNGNAIYNSGTMTVKNSTFGKNQSIYNLKDKGTLTFEGTITLAGLLEGSGKYNVAGANFILGQGVALNNLDFSAATITVDGALYKGEAVTIATKIGKIGAYTIANNTDPFLTLEVVGGNLLLKEVDAILAEGKTATTLEGKGSNIISGGTVGTFFATKGDDKEIATKISGGKVESNLVGGAYAKATEAGFSGATIGKVELNIGGTAEVAAKVYAGGYLYGNDAESLEAQMTVDEVNITIDGGAVSTNMFGGAHARQNGNASVTEVNITVTAGTHSRIYAGGWAEKDAVSSVGTANVTISGGSVDYLYGAGANADGKTYVGTSNITISGDAEVNTIFMGGRYGYSYVDTVNLTFAGEAKELKRLSGVSSAGMESADATVVELETNVTADLIDYVDKFVINEDCTLTANNEFILGNRIEGGAEAGVTTFDFITDGLDEAWTAIAGIKDFTNAQFSINGAGLTAWDGKAAIAIGGYELTYDAEKKTITLANA